VTASSLPVDVIEVRGIQGYGRHGVHDAERTLGQRFVVDIRLELDTRPAAKSGRLDDTVDYAKVADAVHEAIENDPVDLIETVAQRIADRCLEFAGVTGVAVTLHKPSAPVTVPFDDVALTVYRRPGEPSD
jgi:7,8-dihydroneopterin aldolase/epimerase/oxygenase